VLALPPALAAATSIGPEPLGLGLAAAGLAVWERNRSRWVAVALFTLAGLSRESLLLIPVVLAAREVLARRGWGTARLAIAPAVWVAWTGVIRARFGVWPWAARGGRLGALFSGLAHGLAHWHSWADVACFALAAVILVACASLRPRDPLAWIVVAYAVLAV